MTCALIRKKPGGGYLLELYQRLGVAPYAQESGETAEELMRRYQRFSWHDPPNTRNKDVVKYGF